MSDFLRTLPSCDASSLWAWPTLSSFDHQFFIWVFTFAYRKQKLKELTSQIEAAQQATKGQKEASGPGELDSTTFTTLGTRPERVQDSALLEMLGGYYDRAKAAVFLVTLLRLGAGGLLAIWTIRRLRGQVSSKL